MFKQTSLVFLLLLQFTLLWLYLGYQNRQPLVYSQTIPTVTPTGAAATNTPAPATSTPEPTATKSNGNTNPTPSITDTPIPDATATPSPASTIAPTPEDGFLPTAAACADSPTIQAFNTLNVRQGPGIDYQIIDQLVFLEVRPIIGRSQYDEWWLVELSNGDSGWVANANGQVQGYIGNVPLVAAPSINGQTPTPGTPWQPTPLPSCTVTPTHTPTVTASATATPSLTATPSATATAVPPTHTPTTTSPSDSNNEADAATRIALSAATIEATPTQAATAYPPRPTAAPLDIATPASTPNFLPVIGLLLIAGGIFAAIARRRFSRQ